MLHQTYPVKGAGLGLRRVLVDPLLDSWPGQIDFLEVAPENWLDVGGILGRQFRKLTEQHDFVCHGLSLNIGGQAPLDEAFLHRLKSFFKTHTIHVYSEHLTYCGDEGHLYDLMPIPFTEEAVHYVANRVKRVQAILEQPLVLENASYYCAPGQQMSELEFIRAVLEEADCGLLLDINNIYVNSVNHGYDAEEFLYGLPGERIVYAHMAGHYNEDDDLIVDTHGSDVIDPVWDLLDKAYRRFGVFPTLLERDFNIPPMDELLQEVDQIAALQSSYYTATHSGLERHG